jgi:TolB-like protein
MLKFGLPLLAVALLSLPGSRLAYAQQNELRSLASSLAEDIASNGKKTIAVIDFTDLQGKSCELGRYLAEELSVALLRTRKGFDLVERNQLHAVLSEHKLTASGLIDQATAMKIGQFTGADTIVTGTMTPFSESVHVAAKALATNTARIVAGDETDLPKTNTISQLLASCGGASAAPASREPLPPPAAATTGIGGGSPPLPQIPDVDGPAIQSVAAEFFRFDLLQCRGSGDAVQCYFRMINQAGDRNLWFWCETSKAYDDSGGQSRDNNCSLANKGQSGVTGASQSTMVRGISTPAKFEFRHLNQSARTLSLITLSARVGGSVNSPMDTREFQVQFRNIPIVR